MMEKRTVSPPAGYDVKAVGEVVVKCIPPPAVEASLPSAMFAAPGEQDSDDIKDLYIAASSEAENTETENFLTVNDADHTAPTATPQAGTTAEEAPNTGAGTPNSVGEGVAANALPAPNGILPSDVKLPDRNTDASSSTAWVRAPLLLLLGTLSSVAVW
ncbi:hypothetical protein DQ04_17321000 [Trypanosoma grayi]|uniref:hypothetical protein n=1 Tax=Trypanosoma grayi TaxID=71804 RepID=UPI0004F3FC8A|nr:hypothetical protein DQ04_17321000 [Trypanosoma grayi]KEG05919.1 hypothetical protein DQ04_17321000 [Trypanosoma grayi]